jgi:hypothetical protein
VADRMRLADRARIGGRGGVALLLLVVAAVLVRLSIMVMAMRHRIVMNVWEHDVRSQRSGVREGHEHDRPDEKDAQELAHGWLHPGKDGVELGSVKKRKHLSTGAPQDIEKLSNLLALLALVAGGDGVLDAMLDMVAKDFLLDLVHRSPNGGDLGDHIDAVAILVDHLRDSADLAFDAAQALEAGAFDFFLHG